MKTKLILFFAVFFLSCSFYNGVMAGRVLDGRKGSRDADGGWLKGEDVVSMSKFVRQIKVYEPEGLAEFETLYLHGTLLSTSSFRTVVEEILPLLPNLKILNLYGSSLREPEDLELLSILLQKFPQLQYVDIVSNGIAGEVPSLVKSTKTKEELAKKFRQKVVFADKVLLDHDFSSPSMERLQDWRATHERYYRERGYAATVF